MNLQDYVAEHTNRGECKCGRCMDVGNKPDPEGHTADMIFFKVAKRNDPTVEEFTSLTRSFKGEFADVDPLDGKEHNYIELGAWIGDQGLAMQYMALGNLLGVFKLMTPRNVLPPELSKELTTELAGAGFLTVQYMGNGLNL